MSSNLGSLLPGGPDPNGKRELSVVYTDRALNHMSLKYQQVMKDIDAILKETYNAYETVIIPGSGTYGMEAAARAFAEGKKAAVIRNGYFSFRWSDIFGVCGIPSEEIVLMARPEGSGPTREFSPIPVQEAVEQIRQQKADVVFAPHVETASGMIIPDDYIRALADAVHENGGVFVLDAIAAGCVWADMNALGVDVLISAPQKGWSGPACCALMCLSERASKVLDKGTGGSSFACNMKKWRMVMRAYLSSEGPGHKYFTTMPTDALTQVRNAMEETRRMGLAKAKRLQIELGDAVRQMMYSKGFKSVAAPAFAAPGVVVLYAPNATFAKGFASHGVQIAGGVPLMIGNGTDTQNDEFRTFRLGLFGLDKITNKEMVVADLGRVVDALNSDLKSSL